MSIIHVRISYNSVTLKGLPVVKVTTVNNTLTCNSPIEIPYYSSGLFKEALVLTMGQNVKNY
ncbi:23233_t:CDS:2 [Rhizophagus irregularis]|nr:23233_t:CDS:2 [Rhizophagus irregularis]